MTPKSKTPDQVPEALIIALDSDHRGNRTFTPGVRTHVRLEDLDLSIVGTEEIEVKNE